MDYRHNNRATKMIAVFIVFFFWFIGCLGEDGICNLDGCDRKAKGWQFNSSKGCYRTSIAKENGWGYCKRSHCVDSLR